MYIQLWREDVKKQVNTTIPQFWAPAEISLLPPQKLTAVSMPRDDVRDGQCPLRAQSSQRLKGTTLF